MRDTLFGRVAEGALRAPRGGLAVASSRASVDFEALLRGARGLAAALKHSGIGRGDRVGVWMEKSPATVQVLLGILASGAAYVSLDPKSPALRCRTISEDAALSAMFVDSAHLQHAEMIANASPECLLIAGDEQIAAALDREPEPLPEVRTGDPAYILYTSGSTGKPKGVVHTHASALAFVDWVHRVIRPGPDDVFSSHAPFHFDLSVSDLYASLSVGAQVRLIDSVEAMVPSWLCRKVAEWGVTVWYSVPSALVSMLDQGGLAAGRWPSLRALFFAGEVFPTPQLRRLREALPEVPLLNLYGPTETNVCTWYEVPRELPEGNAPIPIGCACDHLETFALTDAGKVSAVGEEGSLWVLGANLMSGYFRADGTPAVGLKPDPRGGDALAYDTGDRVVVRPDGGYDFRGRRDHQIKTRGYRVELNEIESAALAHPNVLEAVAWAIPHPRYGNRLAITAVPRNGVVLEPEMVRAICAERLPTYMVPEVVDVRPVLPRTSTGKADRNALLKDWEGWE